ncbi:MAG: glycosyltransferase family 2 protein [Bacteroidetes bacterium]|nr:glycosyltransferase family 2 protein [Bacteroidota bacterium]
MKVCGFSFIRNAVSLDYPVSEAIRSVLPLVDEMFVAVGKSEDSTRELVESLGPQIRIIDTVWDDSLREGGKVLAVETDKAMDAIPDEYNWCFYIQADECLHEKFIPAIKEAMEKFVDDKRVDGLLFGYKHFYGSYDYLGDSRTWYRSEIRVIRNDKRIRSWKDAQGFRKDGKKLQVKKVAADIYHYGWVRHPKYMMAKAYAANKLWHDDNWVEQRFDPEKDFDYSAIDSVQRFSGTHPAVMQKRIDEKNWKFDHDPKSKKFGFKTFVLYYFEKLTGHRIGENKNYFLLKN